MLAERNEVPIWVSERQTQCNAVGHCIPQARGWDRRMSSAGLELLGQHQTRIFNVPNVKSQEVF